MQQFNKHKRNIIITSVIILAAVVVLMGLMYSVQWDGMTLWTFHVQIINGPKNKPIPNVKVSIVVTDKSVLFAEKDTISVITDSNGFCDITTYYHAYGTRSLFRKTHSINFSHRALLAQINDDSLYERQLKEIVYNPDVKSKRCTTNVSIVVP